ncbi:MAG TPA: YjjG family noncanonical pyrimidine nucleotidase [Flavobacteriaceae bacterium]|nr:YjjG family noncanonical pyrimidine nucleotidase [Flavobacteriaceae bacterium]
MKNITDIFFDLDHTLWDFDKNSALAFEAVFAKNKIEIELSAFLEIYVPINHHYWEEYRYGKILQKDLRFNRLQDTFTELKIQLSKEKIRQISEEYIQHLPKSNHLFPDVIEALEYLYKKYNLHIITDGFEPVQWKKLHNSNINHYFKSVTTSEEAGAKKPNAMIFDCAIKKAGCNKNTALMIGDNLEADVQGALKYGMQAVYFSTNTNHDGITIDSHRHLMKML